MIQCMSHIQSSTNCNCSSRKYQHALEPNISGNDLNRHEPFIVTSCVDLISTTHSVAFLFQFLVVFFSIVSCNERPRLSLSTSDNMQRLEREMRGLGRIRRASAPPSSRILHRERGNYFASSL